MILSIPLKYLVSEVIGYLKGKSVIAVTRQFGGHNRYFKGEGFCARSYVVSTIGYELEKVRDYVKNQDQFEGQGSDEEGSFLVFND